MSASAAPWMLIGSMLFMGPFLGMLATLMSIGAIAGRTPMMGAKIGMNYLVALVFGLLLPRPVAVG